MSFQSNRVRKGRKRPSAIVEVVVPHLALQRVTLCVCVCVCFNAFQQEGHLGLNPERSAQFGVKGDTQL